MKGQSRFYRVNASNRGTVTHGEHVCSEVRSVSKEPGSSGDNSDAQRSARQKATLPSVEGLNSQETKSCLKLHKIFLHRPET